VRRPKPFWWPSNTNAEVMALRAMHFIRATTMGHPLSTLVDVHKVAWADLRG
jgi:hypothetical protein